MFVLLCRGYRHRGPAAGRRPGDHRLAEEGGAPDMGADGGQTGDGRQHRMRL